MNFTAFAALVRKDLLLFFKDRRSVMMSFAAPIAIASFFGLVLGGAASKDTRQKITVWYVDQDHSAITTRLAQRLEQEKSFELKTGSVEAVARAAVRSGDAAAAVIVPAGFGALAGTALLGVSAKPALTVLYDPSRGAEHEMLKGMLTGYVMEVVGQDVFGGGATSDAVIARGLKELQAAKDLPKGERESISKLLESVNGWNAAQRKNGIVRRGGGLTQPFELNDQAVTARPELTYNSFAHSFTGMGVQFILFMGIEAGVMLLQQRQRGLWKRLRAAPVSRTLLLSSRAVSAALSALIIMAVLFTFARVVFNVRVEGSFAGFLLVCFCFALMTAAFGLLVAAFGKTPEATRPLAIFVTLIMVMLGGSWVPSFLFPAWLDKATKIVPTRWAVDGLNGMTSRGLGFDYALTCSGVLLIFAALFAGLAVRQFRWEID